jgi:hypothetical protein
MQSTNYSQTPVNIMRDAREMLATLCVDSIDSIVVAGPARSHEGKLHRQSSIS